MTQPSDPRDPHPLSAGWDDRTEVLPAEPTPAEPCCMVFWFTLA